MLVLSDSLRTNHRAAGVDALREAFTSVDLSSA